MAQKRNRQRKNSNSKNHDVLGVLLIAFSLFFLLCICIPPLLSVVSEGIFSTVLGVFGIVAYPILIAILMLGVFLILRKQFSLTRKNVICAVILIICAMFILQLATTHEFLGKGYSHYIDRTYKSKYSAGGIVMGALAYGVQSAITEAGSYILFTVAIIVTLVVMLDVVGRIRARRSSVSALETTVKPSRQFVTEDEAQRVVPVGPQNRLFVGEIESKRSVPIFSESGMASDIPQQSKRTVTDYTSSPIIEYFDGTGKKRDAAEQALYGAADEINELERKEFEVKETHGKVEPPSPPPQKHVRSSRDYDAHDYGVLPENIAEPYQRVNEDAQNNAHRPKKIDHETPTDPKMQMQIFFPAPKKIEFNPSDDIISDDDLAAGLKEDAKKFTRSDMESSDDEPHFSMPKFTPKESVFSDDTFESFDIIAPPTVRSDSLYSDPEPVEEEREDIIDAFEMKKLYSEDIREDEPYKPTQSDDDIITDISPSNQSNTYFSTPVTSSVRDDIIDSVKPVKNEPVVSAYEPEDDGIIDGLTISSGPAVDLSETHDITSDIIEGDDRSGMYVSADNDVELPRASKKSKSRTAPIDNQISIESELQRKADESIVVNDSVRRKRYNYAAPPIDLLKTYEKAELSQEDLEKKANRLAEVIGGFLKTTVNVINIVPGPTVTRYEIELPSGIPVKNIESRVADIEYELATVSHIRIEAPIPGKRAIGIEIPNETRSIVGLRDVIESHEFSGAKSALTFSVGKDISGSVVLCDLLKVPHLLIAGQTGSGKSACLNGLLVSLLYKSSPEDLRFILVDPKRVEFSAYRGMPHLLFDRIIYEPNEVLNALKWGCMEMERRYTLMSKYGRNNVGSYNELDEVKSGKLDRISQIVIVIDELADIMQSSVKREIEEKIKTIAAKARAAGIHLIVATQRPSADVITGTIKANLTSRIAFRVSSQIDSRIIIDTVGAEALVGNGDMLFFPVDYQAAKRVQGSFISDTEVLSVINYIKGHYECDFDESAADFVFSSDRGGAGGMGGDMSKEDELFPSVLEFVIKNSTASISGIQRRFSIGYSRAARIVDIMEQLNYIGPATNNGKPREVLITIEKYKELYGREIED